MNVRFRTRLLVLFGCIVLLAGLVTSAAVLSTTKRQRLADATKQLNTGAKVITQAVDSRAEILATSVATLTADFGFRQAVATGESETISLMLLNHGGRIGADLAAVVGLDGQIVSSTDEQTLTGTFTYPELLQHAEDRRPHTDVVMIDGQAYQLVVAPIFLPQQVGWACIGFLVDDALVSELSGLTSLDVAIIGQSLAASNLRALAATSQDAVAAYLAGDHEQRWMSIPARLSATGGFGVSAVMQLSMDEVLEAYYRLRRQLLTIFGLSLAASVGACLLIARRISRPLSQLMRFAKSIRRGDYSAESNVSSTDEFGVLATTLDEMRQSIAERENRITYQLQHDSLTGLPNEEGQRIEMLRRIELQESFSVIHLRVDRFIELNEALGSQLGDQVLCRLAKRLGRAVAATDFVARRSPQTFAVITGITNEEAVEAFVMMLRETLEVPIKAGNVVANVLIACGSSRFPEDGNDTVKLTRRADIALSEAAKQPARFEIYRSGQEEAKRRKLSIVNDLVTAINEDQLFLLYQPKVNALLRECKSVEALVRWEHPKYGFMQPDEFIAIAEQAGLIGHLTNWLIKKATSQIAEWRDKGIDLTVAINLSALDLTNPELPRMCSDAINAHSLIADKLILEITESAMMEDTKSALKILDELADRGFELSIDDFGTGHSSMAQLANLPANQLKIDKSFVQAMEQDEKSLNIVRSMISLAKSLNLKVVAEGVETVSMWQTLEELGCDDLQGYLFSRPITPSEIADWLQKRLPGVTTETYDVSQLTRVLNAS